MIRRINKKNDLKDIIKSCPSGVIDDIYKIEYYIQGYNTSIDATFTKVNNVLEVILPSGDLETLPNGILMRRAYYKVVDTSYPDGYYNLEFEDNMNIWLGEYEASPVPPAPGDYVTEGELVSTLSSYATQSWISSQQFATESWVSEQGYITSSGASGLATMSWVESQGYLTSETLPSDIATQSWVSSNYVSTTTLSSYTTFTDIDSYVLSFWHRAAEEFYSDYVPRREIGGYLTGYATESWVSSNFLSATALSGYATQSWVSAQGYLTSETIPSDIATQSWVSEQGYLSEVPAGYATESWVESQGYITSESASGFATMSWVESQGYVKSDSTLLLTSTFSTVAGVIDVQSFRAQTLVFGEIVEGNELGTYVGISAGYFNTFGGNTFYQPFATEDWVSNNFLSSTALSGYATQSWVSAQGYLTAVPSGYATESWVSGQGYLTSVPSEYATQSWVESQGYLTAVPSEYATKSWATSEFFEESKIWTGTQSQWEALTTEQQATYTIALVTE